MYLKIFIVKLTFNKILKRKKWIFQKKKKMALKQHFHHIYSNLKTCKSKTKNPKNKLMVIRLFLESKAAPVTGR